MKKFQFKNLSKCGEINHLISTRKGGFSRHPFNSLNISIHIDDDEAVVIENRKLVAKELGIDAEDLIFCRQTHSDRVGVYKKGIKKIEKVKGFQELDNTDAVITNQVGKAILVMVADCVPLLLFDPVNKAIGAVHAGWPGTMRKIAEKTVARMVKEYGSNPRNILAGIGPSIEAECYPIEKERAQLIARELKEDTEAVLRKKGKRFHFDLWRANQLQLLRAGLRAENIETARICTHCHVEEYFSYRAEQEALAETGKRKHAGRFGASIVLRK